MKKLSAALLTCCLLLSLAACGENSIARVSASPAASAPPPPAVSAKLSRDHASISLTLPEGWEYAETDEDDRFGLKFWPEEEPGATAALWYWTDGFGMCGTGVAFSKVTLPSGLSATKATENGGSGCLYDLIYHDTAGSYVGECFTSKELWKKYGADIEAILGSAVLGEGNLSESQAVDAALPLCTIDYSKEKTRAEFDYLTGTWEITFASDSQKTLQTVTVGNDGTAALAQS